MSFISITNDINRQINATTQAAPVATQLVEQTAPDDASSFTKLAIGAQAFATLLGVANPSIAAGAILGNSILNAAVLVQNLFGLFKKKKTPAPVIPIAATIVTAQPLKIVEEDN